jgi:uncharacterized membrane protein YccC
MTHNGRPDKLDRIERMLQMHAEILNQLSPLLTQVAQIATSTVESVSRHDEILSRLAEQSLYNATAVHKLQQCLEQLTEIVKTSTTQSVQIANENNQYLHHNWDLLSGRSSNFQDRE